MSKRWIASLALSLGLLANTARAADDPWRVPAKPTPASAPAVTIGRPVAVEDAPPPQVDTQVKPTGFMPAPSALPDAGSGMSSADPSIPRPLPVGTPSPSANLHKWTAEPPTSSGTGPSAANTLGKPTAADDSTLPSPRVDAASSAPAPLWTQYRSSAFSGDGGTDCGTNSGACPVANCFPGCCPGGCCADNRWYASAEALAWWMKGQHVPPLVTTGSAADAVPGALGQPGTEVLFGGGQLNTGADGGGRFLLGFWITRDHCLGFEGSYWFLGSKTDTFSASSTGDPLLFRPFTNETGAQDVEIVAVPSPTGPGIIGSVAVRSRTSLWGAEGNFRSNLCCGPVWTIDGLAGFRTMGLDDDLSINESLLTATGVTIPSRGITVPAGTTFLVGDRFQTVNRFYGGQLGLDMECHKGNWIFGIETKVALGMTTQLAEINGATTIGVPGVGSTTYQGGLLAQNSNIGHYNRDVFSVVPEVGLKVGYQINEHWRATIGYNFIYWSSVARAGEQIDTTVNRAQLPPPSGTGDRPAFSFHDTSFWAQGITLGLEFRW
jgi:hypothetical protein